MINIYCDESCHLPNDGNKIMVIGGIWCPTDAAKHINERIREIKQSYSISTEMKWVKISEAKKNAYLDIVNYFFNNDDLHFRVLVIDNKNDLDHISFNQTHDEWYYKMYFEMIRVILSPAQQYCIYLDIKDTKSKTKIFKLREVLSNDRFDYSRKLISNIQVIRSHEVEMMQIVDILIGAMGYISRGLNKVNAKNEIVDLIKKRSGYKLNKSTLLKEDKYNIFHLKLRKTGCNDYEQYQ